MGIRRRRRKLTTLVSRLDQRVRSVELRPINLLSEDQVNAAVSLGDGAAQPTNIVSSDAPNEFRKIHDAYIYPKSLTGSEDRVAVYFESDLGLEVSDTIEISGIHGTQDFDLDASGEFEVKHADSAPFYDEETTEPEPTASIDPSSASIEPSADPGLEMPEIQPSFRFDIDYEDDPEGYANTLQEVQDAQPEYPTFNTNIRQLEAPAKPYAYGPLQARFYESRKATGPLAARFYESLRDTSTTDSYDSSFSSGGTTSGTTSSGTSGSRADWKHDPREDQLPGVTITNEYSYRPATEPPITWGASYRRLQTKRLVDSYSITNSEVTLTMNAVHKFKVDDAVYVDIFAEDSRAFGVDGLFRITAVTDNTITYTLDSGVDEPTGDVTPTEDVYVFPVGRNYVPVGSTWSNSSNNKIYVWDGLRWVDYSVAEVEADDDPPSPPTDLEITDEPKAGNATTGYRTYSEVAFTWTPPTTSESGEELTDLLGYRFGWRLSPGADWTYVKVDDPNLSSYTLGPEAAIQQGETYYFKLEAYDSGLQYSTPVEATHETQINTGDLTVYPPTNPVATTRLGTVTVTWDNRLSTGPTTTIAAPDDTAKMRVYLSLDNVNFDPVADATYFSSQDTFAVLTDLEYNNTYYIKITILNTAGSEGPFSGVVAVQPKALVDTDAIASTLSNWMFNGRVVPPGSLADGSIDATNLFGSNVIVQDAIAANAIGASEIAAGAIVAGKIGANAITSNTIAANAIIAGKINTNAVTADTIRAGAVEAEKIATRAIIANKIDTGAVTADAIKAGEITADKLQSSFVLSNLISTGNPGQERIEIRGKDQSFPGIVSFDGQGGTRFRFYNDGRNYLDGTLQVTGTIDVSGVIEGGTIRTSGGGNRVQMSGPSNELQFFDGGSIVGTLEGTSSGARLQGSGSAPGSVTVSSSNAILRSSSGHSSISCTNDRTFIRGTDGNTLTSSNSSFIRLNEKIEFNAGSTSGADYIFDGTTNAVEIEDLSGSSISDVGTFANGQLYRSSSDIRLKENIEETNLGLDFINDLRPVKFNWKVEEMGDLTNYGLIAQEVRESLVNHGAEESSSIVYEQGPSKVFDRYIEEGGDPILGFEIKGLIPALIQSVKELSAKNRELEARLEALEGGD